jgi:hypothetical protein
MLSQKSAAKPIKYLLAQQINLFADLGRARSCRRFFQSVVHLKLSRVGKTIHHFSLEAMGHRFQVSNGGIRPLTKLNNRRLLGFSNSPSGVSRRGEKSTFQIVEIECDGPYKDFINTNLCGYG